MPSANMPDAVKAMRSYYFVINAIPNSPEVLSSWIQRHTDEALAADFDYRAAIAVLHHFNHPLYSNTSNHPSGTTSWCNLMTGAETILQDEQAWINDQLEIANITRPQRLFESDITWLNAWATANGVPQNLATAFLVNMLIQQLRTCEGSNGATGAGGISHTERNPPTNLP